MSYLPNKLKKNNTTVAKKLFSAVINNNNIFIYIAPLKTEFTKCFDRQSKGSTIQKQRHMTQKAITSLKLRR